MMHYGETGRGESCLSPKDEAQWARIVEGLPHTIITSDVYSLLDLSGKRGAVIGGFMLPFDMLPLQLAYSLSSTGKLYLVDPQGYTGVSGPDDAIVVGAGDAWLYQRDVEYLKRQAFPLASVKWLGNKSSLVNIPKPARNLDCIADHWTLEFIATDYRVDEAYIQRGLAEIIGSLRVGGLFVHHSMDAGSSLRAYAFGQDNEQLMSWLTSRGMRMVSHTLDADSYRFKVDKAILQGFLSSDDMTRIFTPHRADIIRLMSRDALVIPEKEIIEYPAREVFVAQKMW